MIVQQTNSFSKHLLEALEVYNLETLWTPIDRSKQEKSQIHGVYSQIQNEPHNKRFDLSSAHFNSPLGFNHPHMLQESAQSVPRFQVQIKKETNAGQGPEFLLAAIATQAPIDKVLVGNFFGKKIQINLYQEQRVLSLEEKKLSLILDYFLNLKILAPTNSIYSEINSRFQTISQKIGIKHSIDWNSIKFHELQHEVSAKLESVGIINDVFTSGRLAIALIKIKEMDFLFTRLEEALCSL
jgi:hypothetical protein